MENKRGKTVWNKKASLNLFIFSLRFGWVIQVDLMAYSVLIWNYSNVHDWCPIAIWGRQRHQWWLSAGRAWWRWLSCRRPPPPRPHLGAAGSWPCGTRSVARSTFGCRENMLKAWSWYLKHLCTWICPSLASWWFLRQGCWHSGHSWGRRSTWR